MRIVDKKSLKRTKLHHKTCVWCGQGFGTYRITRKLCSHNCKLAHNGFARKRGEERMCESCGGMFWAQPSQDRRGSVRKYCTRDCWHKNKKLGLPVGEYLSYDGYIVVNRTDDGRKQIKKHRLIAEQYIGRRLSPYEVVHHINEDKLDNHPDNLFVCSRAVHNQIHRGTYNGKTRPVSCYS